MDYKKLYNNLINKYKKLNLPKLKIWDPDSVSIETHHIIPRCLKGKDNKDNLVNLTSKAHYVAHHLLYKANIGTKNEHKLLKAFAAMIYLEDPQYQRRKIKITSGVFQKLKNKLSIVNSLQSRGRWESFSQDKKDTILQKNHTLESNEKRRLTCSKIIKTKEWNEKNRLAHLGKKHSAEHINNMKNGLKHFWASEKGNKQKQQVSLRFSNKIPWNKGKKRTNEERYKISQGRKRNYQLRKFCKILNTYINK